jgi:RHS repeat-associated protein
VALFHIPDFLARSIVCGRRRPLPSAGRDAKAPFIAVYSRNLVALATLVFLTATVQAQVTNVTDVESTPIPGTGHDYLHMLNETINPANGSLSVRINVPVPEGRSLTLPFSFAYDSNAAIPGAIQSGISPYLFKVGWSYSAPMLTAQQAEQKGNSNCSMNTGYVFYDAQATRHALDGIVLVQQGSACQNLGYYSFLTGGDAWLSANASGFTVQDADGLTYIFPGAAAGVGESALISSAEDRNGNVIEYHNNGNGAFTETDTAGRTVISSNGFGATGDTVTVSGIPNPYSLVWGTSATWNYSAGVDLVYQTPNSTCSSSPTTQPSGSSSALSTVTLPNGRGYAFSYDPTYGLLNEIVYPTGAWVKYTWGFNSQSEAYIGGAAAAGSSSGHCYYRFGVPVITKRQVSYNGVTVAEEQDFTYSTTWHDNGYDLTASQWTAKSTTVTTYDLIRNPNRGLSYQTTYIYVPLSIPPPPNAPSAIATQVPVESQIVYQDWTGSTLQTVNKTWLNQYLMSSKQTVLPNGLASQVNYTYGKLGVVTNKREFDYGQSASGSPTRQAIANYQSFPINALGSYIYDRPCQVLIEDGGGNKVSETDYFYDNGSTGTVCGAAGRPSVSSAGGVSLTGHDETNYGVNSGTCGGMSCSRGNATQKTQWSNTGTSPVTTYAYDETGQTVAVTDPCGNGTCSDMIQGAQHTTTYSFADSYANGLPPGMTNAYLTKLTNGLGQSSKFTYSYGDGQLISSTDPNNQVTSYTYNTPPSGCSFSDGLDRLSQIYNPDGGTTSYCYDDAPYNASTPSPSITTTQGISTGSGKVSTTAYDGVGHPVETILSSDPDGATYTAVTYDGEGKEYTVSNPYRNTSDPTNGIATYSYDGLGRTTSVAEQDGSAVATSYSSNCRTVSDEVGNQRTSCQDSFGRLTVVYEAPNVTGYNYETKYTFDLLDDLTLVTQNGSNSSTPRIRSFVYDSLARLTSAKNPEVSGPITFSYDLNSNLSSKTAPAPNQAGTATVATNYSYDALNRLTQKSYINLSTPSALYAYDGAALTGCYIPLITNPTNLVGRRSAMCSGNSSSSSFSYDPMGRLIVEERTNAGSSAQTYATDYAYYKDGSLNTLTYPSGDVVTYTVNGAGRATQASDSSNNFAAAASYAPQGALAGMTSGSGIVTANLYNDRLQPTLLSASVSSSPIFSLCYDFHLGVAVSACNLSAYTTGDNGNLFQTLNNVDNTRSMIFAYDPLNRIAQANTVNTTSSNCWGEAYTIDPWANLTNIAAAPGMAGNCSTEGLSSSGANTQNQLLGLGLWYDAAGNLIKDNLGNQPTYDAENRIATVAGYTYSYDADGTRMEKANGSSGTMYWPGPAGTLSETNLAGTINEEYIYFNGQRIARVDRPSGAVHYYFSNHLGSHTMVTSATGSCEQDIDYFPYGGEITDHCPNVAQHYKFTGKERDTESGLDNFGFRYNASTMGRFMSPDPSTNLVIRAINPQRWNQYAYAINNPTNYVDHDGRDAAAVNFSGMVAGLGHEGLLIIDKDGSATYARFGPEDHSLGNLGGASAPGEIQTFNNIPTVQFGSNGLPTDASIKAVAAAVAQDESTPGAAIDPSTVRINYFQTGSTDTALAKEWAQAQQEHSQNGQGPYGHYCVTSNNCATFTATGLVAGGAITAEQARGLSIDPNRMFQQLSRLANDNFDLLHMQVKQPEKACVTTYGPNGPDTHCE